MCFHSSAFTVGITKKGEISSTRTMPRPGNGSLTSRRAAMPITTVISDHRAEQQQRVPAPRPEVRVGDEVLKVLEAREALVAGLHEVVADEREIDRHHSGTIIQRKSVATAGAISARGRNRFMW
jgi:hypothetical protein